MKKFYSILTLAAISAGFCLAAAPARHEITLSEKVSAPRVLPAAPAPRSLAAKAPAMVAKASALFAPDIAGNYMLQAYNAIEDGGFQTLSSSAIEFVKGDQVNVLGFWVGSDEQGRPNGSIASTYDQGAGTLTIPCGPIGKYSGKDYYLYYQDWNTFEIIDKDLVLEQEGKNFFWVEPDWKRTGRAKFNYIITDAPHKAGDKVEIGFGYFLQVELNKWNSIQLLGDLSDPTVAPAWTEISADGFIVDNLGGLSFGLPLSFTADKANNSCSAPRLLYGEDIALSEDLTSDVYIASPGGGDITGIFQVSEEDGVTSTIVKVNPFCLYSPTVPQLATNTTISTCFLQLNFDLTSGIGSAIVDDPAAPAAYYNLQGVRVENPRGLVIRVQNGKATKTFVK